MICLLASFLMNVIVQIKWEFEVGK